MKLIKNFPTLKLTSTWFAVMDIKLIQFLSKQQFYKYDIILYSLFKLLGNLFIEEYWNLLRKRVNNFLKNPFCLFLL